MKLLIPNVDVFAFIKIKFSTFAADALVRYPHCDYFLQTEQSRISFMLRPFCSGVRGKRYNNKTGKNRLQNIYNTKTHLHEILSEVIVL